MSNTPRNGGARDQCILLVDDNARMRNLRAIILSTNGYEVESTSNSAEAHRLWEASRPDLVLVALSRHTRGSLELLEAIKRVSPQQRMAFLISDSLYLSPLFYDGVMIREGEGPEDFVARVGALLAAV